MWLVWCFYTCWNIALLYSEQIDIYLLLLLLMMMMITLQVSDVVGKDATAEEIAAAFASVSSLVEFKATQVYRRLSVARPPPPAPALMAPMRVPMACGMAGGGGAMRDDDVSIDEVEGAMLNRCEVRGFVNVCQTCEPTDAFAWEEEIADERAAPCGVAMSSSAPEVQQSSEYVTNARLTKMQIKRVHVRNMNKCG